MKVKNGRMYVLDFISLRIAQTDKNDTRKEGG